MELLTNDQRREAAGASADDTHAYVVRGVPSDDDESMHSDEATVDASAAVTGDPLLSTAESDETEPPFRSLPLRASTRRKIGKALQLVLLRKYVQSAKQLDGIPDRATTERLLDQAYDEFYFHGGDVNEQRMGYSAFVKLVRNRRGEFVRLNRTGRDPSSHHKKHANEKQEIHALVAELERVRRNEQQRRAAQGLNATRDRETTHDSPTDTTNPSSDQSTTPIPMALTLINGEEHVLVPKHKLECILQSAQETLEAQAKLLAQVHALERQLSQMQQRNPFNAPLGH